MSTLMLKVLIGTRDVGRRYGGKHPRTIKRWVVQGAIPPPDLKIKNRDYWYVDRLDQHDRQLVANVPGSEGVNRLIRR